MSKGKRSLNKFFTANQFIGSFKDVKNLPTLNNLFECCFVGRSNVGKSSIINAITKNKKLAKTSKTPGRTQAINIFSIKEDINIVDLPGYGYAKISKVLREQLSYLIETYIKDRENLSHIFLLVDAKVGIKNSDIDMLDLINFFQKKFSIIFTKIDKCSKSHIDNQNNSILSLMKNYPNIFTQTFFTSIKTNEGIIDVQKEIYRLSKNL